MTAATKSGQRTGRKRGHGEGTIYQRQNGQWTAQFSHPSGKRLTFYGKTRREVQEKLRLAQNEADRGTPLADKRLTVSGFLGTWLESVHASVRPRTHESYALNVRRVTPRIGHIKLSALPPADLQRCYAELLSRDLSRRSVEQTHTVLHTALEQAVKWGHIARNVADIVNVPRPGRREMHTLTTEQVERLFTTTEGDRWYGLWVTLATAGLRLGEALGLMWSDLDLQGGRLTIQRALQRQRGAGLVFVEPKTALSRRTVHLPEIAVSALRRHRQIQNLERLAVGPAWKNAGLVFATTGGAPVDPPWVTRNLQRALERAELPRVRVHDLRHTAATLLLGRGVHPKVVQELLGHSTITLTLDTYSHTTPALHAAAARQMDELLTQARVQAAVVPM